MAIDAMRPFPTTTVPSPEGHVTLEAAYRAHAPVLRGRLLRLTRDPSLADDLASEAFLRLATEIDAGRAPLEPAAWLYRVGSNLMISRARRVAVATRAMPGLLERDLAPSPEDEVVRRERNEVLHGVLATLRGHDREIVVLAAQGYRPEEIARMTGRSGPATRTRLCRARGRLRVQLEMAGMTA